LYRQADRLLIDAAVVVPRAYPRLHFLVKPWLRYAISPTKYWLWKEVNIEPH
jgi:hypothetical protein